MRRKFRYKIISAATSWKVVLLLGLTAASLHIINLSLSWWIEVLSSNKLEQAKQEVLSSYLNRKVTSSFPEILDRLLQTSVLDGSGEYKFVVSILRGSGQKSFTNYDGSPVKSVEAKEVELRDEISLVTQCSLSHLNLLPDLAERWKGPISIAIFLLAEEVHLGLQLMLSLTKCIPELQANTTFSVVYPLSSPKFPQIDSSSVHIQCSQVLASLSKLEKPNYEHSGISYPNNLLRNVARKAVRSTYMMVLDIDMLPSVDMRIRFLHYLQENYSGIKKGNPSKAEDDKTVWVIPSYEVEDAKVPKDKEELLELRKVGKARPFYQELCWKCQKYTEYEAWENQLNTRQSQIKHLYEVLWRDPWEPFYISRANVPLYDERFRQYGFNRISQVCELHVAGYRFLVLDSAFVVHKGFKKAKILHQTKDEELEKNRILFRQFKANLKEKYPDSSRRCY